LKYLLRGNKAKGLVMVSTPIDYPMSFYTILRRALQRYDLMRWLLLMEHFPVMPELEKLMSSMFRDQATSLDNSVRRLERKTYSFTGDEVKECFKHANMLEFASPEPLLMNREYREFLDELSSLQDSHLLLRVEERVSAQFFHNECGEGADEGKECKEGDNANEGVDGAKDEEDICMLRKNNMELLEKASKSPHIMPSMAMRTRCSVNAKSGKFGKSFLRAGSRTFMELGTILSWIEIEILSKLCPSIWRVSDNRLESLA
jgi:hypothetical protein